MSDGLIDAMNGEGEILGIEKIAELLAECGGDSPQQILQTLFSYVEGYSNGHAQQDDRTAAVLRYSGSS